VLFNVVEQRHSGTRKPIAGLCSQLLQPYSISKKKQLKCKEEKYMVIKMMRGKKHISIEDVISEKQIKFSSNLQDEAVEKCQIQSIQVEEIVQITELHR
jgi:hypothetical protein